MAARTPEEIYVELVGNMSAILNCINQMKDAQIGDPRCLAVAATNLETSILWVANARPEES